LNLGDQLQGHLEVGSNKVVGIVDNAMEAREDFVNEDLDVELEVDNGLEQRLSVNLDNRGGSELGYKRKIWMVSSRSGNDELEIGRRCETHRSGQYQP
jgi:hypothetical protein